MAFHRASFVLIALASVVAVVDSQVVFGRGDCPVTGTQASFDRSRYLNKWYEYERFANLFEIGVVCGTATYGNNDDGSISVVNAGKREFKLFGLTIYSSPTVAEGKATVPDPSKPAELRVSFSESQEGGDANYFVVDTDYDNYAVIFSCNKIPLINLNTQILWILTRQAGVAPSNLATIKSNLQSFGIDTTKLRIIRQTDCS